MDHRLALSDRKNFRPGTVGLALSLILSALIPNVIYAASDDACAYFFSVLDAVPHLNLNRINGLHQSLWDGRTYNGCEINFETNVALLMGRSVPDFVATEETEIYRMGWRDNSLFTADGAGTGSFGIEKGPTLCLVNHAQPAYIEDTGDIVQSEMWHIAIQCRDRQ